VALHPPCPDRADLQRIGISDPVPRSQGFDHRQGREPVGLGLPPVIVHGRGEHVRIPSLAAGADTSVRYRGRNIDYTRRNRYENRISAEWYVEGNRRERLLVGTYSFPNLNLVLTFHAPDSLSVSSH